jgi:hypothetical protein
MEVCGYRDFLPNRSTLAANSFMDALNATQFTFQLTGAGGESSPVVSQKGNSHQ